MISLTFVIMFLAQALSNTYIYAYMYNMPPVALIFPSTWKSPRIPPTYAKKDKNTDFAYAAGKNAKICVRKMVCVRKETRIPN